MFPADSQTKFLHTQLKLTKSSDSVSLEIVDKLLGPKVEVEGSEEEGFHLTYSLTVDGVNTGELEFDEFNDLLNFYNRNRDRFKEEPVGVIGSEDPEDFWQVDVAETMKKGSDFAAKHSSNNVKSVYERALMEGKPVTEGAITRAEKAQEEDLHSNYVDGLVDILSATVLSAVVYEEETMEETQSLLPYFREVRLLREE